MNNRKALLILVLVLGTPIACLLQWCGPLVGAAGLGALTGIAMWWDSNPRSNTSPLPAAVVQDMCARLELPADDWRCQPDAQVYADEFEQSIVEALRSQDGQAATFEQVDALLGPYEVRRESLSEREDGTKYFRVFYDLKGDGVYRFVIFFEEDGRLIRFSFGG